MAKTCRITRDNRGNIIRVLNPQGKESKLFNQIAELPHVESLEQAVVIYEEILKANPGQDGIQEGFYSNALKALSNIKDKAVKNIKGWVNQLTDAQKTGIKNVKQELDWLGLEDYLNSWLLSKNKKTFKVTDDLENNSIIELDFEEGSIVIGEAFDDGLLDEYEKEFSDLSSYAEIQGVEVDRSRRGKGAGTKMMRESISYIYEKFGLVDIFLNASKTDTNGLSDRQLANWYKKFGFKELLDQGNVLMVKRAPKKISSRNENIPFEVIEQYIEDNQIEIVEVSKSTLSINRELLKEVRDKKSRLDYLLDSMTLDYNSIHGKELSPSELLVKLKVISDFKEDKEIFEKFKGVQLKSTLQDFEEYKTIRIELRNLPEVDDIEKIEDTTKYRNYQLEGGENYREILLTLPNTKLKKAAAEYEAFEKTLNSKPVPEEKIAEFNRLRDNIGKAKDSSEKRYNSSHFDESNILAHIRLNERTLSNGERVLFIEEIQSDWAQEGKKKGFKKTEKEYNKDWEIEDNKYTSFIEKMQEKYGENWGEELTKTEVEEETVFLDNRENTRGGVTPNMPYKKTDQWVGMAMRRVMQMATQEGFDRVAWATGEQSADRYDLSKTISRVLYNPDSKFLGAYDLSGNTVLEKKGIEENKIEDYVGKEVAKKLIDDKNASYKHESKGGGVNFYEMEGADLKIGGEGMKTFYNSILPKVAKKEAQRFDKNAKVDVIDFRSKTNTRNTTELAKLKQEIEAQESKSQQDLDMLVNIESAMKAGEAEKATIVNEQLSITITDKMKGSLLSEIPFFSLESGGTKYKSFNEALDNTTSKTIDIVSNGIVIASFPSTVDEGTLEGVINSLIVDGIIKPNKITFNGKTYFQTTGETHSDRTVSEEFLKEVLGESLDKEQYTIKNSLVELRPKTEGESTKGSLHKVIVDKMLEYFSTDTIISKKVKIDENNLKLNLMKILSDMGVSVMSLKQYQDSFKQKSKYIPPSAEALADITNRVIAFKDGQLNLDNLTEEVMHLIVETLPKEQLEELSELIKNSKEYQDYYEQYKEVYNNNNTLIEKEILGKILKNITLNKTQGKEQSIVSRLLDIIKNFFANLTISQTQRDQLKQLNGLVDRFVIEQNGDNFTESDLDQSREIALMYSLSDQVSNTQGAFEKTFKNITDFKQFNSYKRELKNISFENLKGRELAVAVSRFIEMSTKLIETTEAAIETSKSKRKALSGQNKAILEDLDNEIASHLDSLAVELNVSIPGIKSTERVKLAEKLRENSAKISELRALNDSTTDDHIKQMVEEVVQQMGQAESEFYREQIEKVLRGEIDDTNKLFSFFGQLHHASNPILNMIGSKIWEMNMKANQGIKEDISPFLNYMADNPKMRKEFEGLFKDGYLGDVVNHRGFNDALLTAEMEAFSTISGQTFKDLDSYKKAKSNDELKELGEEKYGKYRTLLQEKQLPLVETVMNEQYYKDLFEKYDRLNISGATQSFLKQNSAERGFIKSNATQIYFDSEGVKRTRVVLSPENNDILNSISKIRKARKNIYSETSTLKKGLKLSTDKPSGESTLLPTGQYLSLDISNEMSQGEKDFANISFDLHKLDNEYMEKAQKEGVTSTSGIAKINFIAYISSLQNSQSEKEIFDIVMSNLDISLSQEFYDTLNGDSFLKGDTLDELNPDNPQLVKDVKELYAKRNSILSIYRNTSSPFEVDRMTDSDQETIRSLSLRISDALRILNLPENTEEGESAGEKAPNKAYVQEIGRRGIQENTQEELDFLINSQHTNISQINKLKDAFNKNKAGIPLSASDSRILSRYLGSDLLQTQLNYAKKNLQPYYTRFAPIGYKSIEERLQSGEDIAEVLHSIFNDDYLSFRVDNSFEEKDNPLKNSDYNDNYDGGFRQPKRGTFVNKAFISQFGINDQGEATKNKELFEVRRLYLEARKVGLEKMNEKGYNPYRQIQISKTTTEKIRTLSKGKDKRATARELIKDTLAYRIDDLAYGEKGFESNRNLPKYYTRDLENQTDVSTDYIFALSQFISRANEYKAKRNVISDIDALYDILLRSKRHSKSKSLKNTIAMADSYIDNSIYGKIENRTYEIKVPGTDYSMDLAKMSRVFTKYVSLKNLGYNTTVPLTGLFSGLVSKRVEEWIGEKLNRDSAKLASAEYKRLFKDGKSQALDFNDNSKLFLIGQAFGIYDISAKARNAKYDKFQRTFSKSAMGLHTMANYPIIPKLALSVMYDNRIIDGKIVNRQQYFQEKTRNGVPIEQIEARWKVAEETAMYNYMNFTKTGFSWSNSIKDLISDEAYLENRKLFMMKFIRAQVSNVDATIPQEMRLAAQRDAIGSMMLLHKGFLSIFLQNRLKRRNLNIDTGLIEEGSYRTLTRLMADFFNTKGGMSEKIDKLKASVQPPNKNASNEEWLEYELNIRNMRRIGKEMVSMGILVTLGALVFAAATDPDNEDIYALQMSSYLMTRLLNESGTAFTPSILTDLSDVIESPIVTYDTAKEFAQSYKLFDGDVIISGKYKGLSVRQRWIVKNALGFKGIYDVYSASNIRESEKTYRMYNEENINRASLGLNSLYKSFYKD